MTATSALNGRTILFISDDIENIPHLKEPIIHTSKSFIYNLQ
jgi:hypothetical protein